jgi:polyferredoxin
MNAPGPQVIKMYAAREEIYPREIKGRYASLRWLFVWLTQLAFYGAPWLQWNGRQALLFDLAARKFYIFGIVLWPQDFIYLAALLIISAYLLFLATAVAGRVWCGFAWPQTVYTEIFLWIERRIEGKRSARMLLDRQPASVSKFAKKSAKHLAWGAVALWTGFTFVGYFTPIKLLGMEVATLTFGPWEWFWVLFYSLATYGNAGWMREQVCKYMCPYARFQSAMFDRDTLIITYDAQRGEPRGLIRYSTERAMDEHFTPTEIRRRTMRTRVKIYTGILLLIMAATSAALYLRVPLKLDVIRDRGAMGREVEEGMIENVYRLQIMNTSEQAHTYRIVVSGIDTLSQVTPDLVRVGATETRGHPIRLRTAHGAGRPGSNKITVELTAVDDTSLHVKEAAVFFVPR